LLERFPQVFSREIAVAEDLVQQAGPQRLTEVDRHYCTSTVFVAKEMMAASDANDLETCFRQASDQFSAGDPWAPAHAAMVIR
jgi:hypothetical protein